MKRFIRCVSVVMVLVMLFSTTAFAAESRGSYYFMCSSVYLYRANSTTNKFEIWFDVTGTHTMLKIGADIIRVQQSADGENWTTVWTFRRDNYPVMICENTFSHMTGLTYVAERGYYYRALINLYAEDSSGVGIMPEYTSPIYIA